MRPCGDVDEVPKGISDKEFDANHTDSMEVLADCKVKHECLVNYIEQGRN